MPGRLRVEDEDWGGGGALSTLVGTAVSMVLDPEEDYLNLSLVNASTVVPTNSSELAGKDIVRHLKPAYQVLITVFYVFGILGNVAALFIITKNETQRYRKQTFMLRCLAGNDLLALLGSFVQMYVQLYLPNANGKLLCASRIIFRAFGLGSGCVALVMAVERWLALTHPFTYQKHVTHAVIRRSILGLWTFNLLVVCAPFAGFGLWYDESFTPPCVRYRLAKSVLDRTYAYLVFAYGMVMCAVIVCCNLAVIRVLCRMRERLLPRRHSRASCRSSSSTCGDHSMNHATVEELSFARLMAVLSIFFVVCWVPQLTTIIVAQVVGANKGIYRLADVFIALNFTLDPYMYVLFRRKQRYSRRHLRKLVTYLCPNRLQGSTDRGLITNSVRSSSHTSHNTNGSTKCRGPSCRDRPLIMKETSVPRTRYPPTLPLVKKSMCLSNYCSPPQRLQKLTASPQSSKATEDTCFVSEQLHIYSRETQNLETEATENRMSYTLSKEAALSGLNTPEVDEHSYVIVHAGESDGKNSWICLSQENSFSVFCEEINKEEDNSSFKNVKRWSFCYGEDERLEILPKSLHKHGLRNRTWLLNPWHTWKMPLWKSQGELWSRMKTDV
ncbi:uncharacterized protein LOC121858208 isoform X2 [Homarus americanus]|uniref:uncharacterized protein LOC121858208 isoform X2 n=1 Tax=Homarus americanus TaxID=6706 RepID=UPI001C471926|nr:uncharacterized protein LOC121858208 isoform X2 [Homarus americanus]